jgi:hypothetical protein
MKKIFISFIFVLFAVVLSSCGGDEYSCSDKEECPNTGGTYEACCTPSDCYYKAGSRKFSCDGTECTAAAMELSEYCYGEGCTEEKLLDVVEELQEELAE